MKLSYNKGQNKQLKYLIYFVITLALIFLQLFFVPLIEIRGIAPNLLILIVIWFVLYEGKFIGLFAGFFIGLLYDVVSLDVIGTNALTKTVVAFMTAWFYKEGKADILIGNIKFIFITIFISIIHNFIYNIFYIKATELNIFDFFIKYGLASAFYTSVFALFPMLFKVKR